MAGYYSNMIPSYQDPVHNPIFHPKETMMMSSQLPYYNKVDDEGTTLPLLELTCSSATNGQDLLFSSSDNQKPAADDTHSPSPQLASVLAYGLLDSQTRNLSSNFNNVNAAATLPNTSSSSNNNINADVPVVGVPVDGLELELMPVDDLELKLAGPQTSKPSSGSLLVGPITVT